MDLFEQQSQLPAAEIKPTGLGPGQQPIDYKSADEIPASPEEQAQYDQFVTRAQEFLTKEPEATIDHMNNKERPVFQNVGRTALMIVKQIEGAAKAAGAELSPELMFNAGQEVVEMLMEMGTAAKIFPFDQNSEEYDQTMAMAFMHGAELAGKEMLRSPEADQYSMEAENMLVHQIAQENERGEVPQEFWDGLTKQVAQRGIPQD